MPTLPNMLYERGLQDANGYLRMDLMPGDAIRKTIF
jgi:hypothetical protein